MFFPNLLDTYLTTYYTLAINLITFLLIIASYAVIAIVVVKSRNQFKVQSGVDEAAAKAKKRSQNLAIAKSAVIMSVSTIAPWVPNLILTLVNQASPALNTNAFVVLVEISNYLFHIVPVICPLLCLKQNASIYRAMILTKNNLCKMLGIAPGSRTRPQQDSLTYNNSKTEQVNATKFTTVREDQNDDMTKL